MNDLDLPGRAALLGLSCREYIAIAESDPRIVAHAACETQASVTRLRRWIEAGRPVANPERVAFTGCDAVRAILVGALAALPAPVLWHAIEYVTWFEVGRGARAWQSAAGQPRAPQGDSEHLVVLNGLIPDDELPGIIGHELSHSWHRCVHAPLSHVPMSEHEWTARLIVVARDGGLDAESVARDRLYEERRANRTTAAWGLPHADDEPFLQRHFGSQVNAAAGLADEISKDLGFGQAEPRSSAERAAAVAITEGDPS